MDQEFNHAANDSPRSGSSKQVTPLVWGAVVDAVMQRQYLARQRVDLQRLLGDGLVQRLYGFVLKHQLRLERIDAVAERLIVTHRIAVPLAAPADPGRARRARRTQNIRRASGSRPPARLPDISGCRP